MARKDNKDNKINIVIDGKKVKVDKDTNKTEVLDQMEEVDDFYLPTNLVEGKIIKSGNKELALELEKKGYENIKDSK